MHCLSKELNEDTNSVRFVLNPPKEVVLPLAKEKGRQKLYSVNTAHQLSNRIVSRIRYTSKQVWIRDLVPCVLTVMRWK